MNINYLIPVIISFGIFLRLYAYFNGLSFWGDEAALALNIMNKSYLELFKGLDYKPNSYNDAKYNNIDIPLLIFENNEIDYLKKEYELLGVYMSTHPISKIKIKKRCATFFQLN